MPVVLVADWAEPSLLSSATRASMAPAAQSACQEWVASGEWRVASGK